MPSSIPEYIAHNNDTHAAAVQAESNAFHPVCELHQLLGAHICQTFDAGDTVTGFGNITHISNFHFWLVCLQFVFLDRR